MDSGMLIILAAGLSMDAFAVSVTNGMSLRTGLWKNALSCGVAFGFFQAIMPLIGYYAGNSFSDIISDYDHWIVLILLGIIGGKMILESIRELRNPGEAADLKDFSLKTLTLQAVATSIDALAVGVGLGVLGTNIYVSVAMIGLITFFFSAAGVAIGKKFGGLFKEKASLVGGVVLVSIGIKIFIEHMLKLP